MTDMTFPIIPFLSHTALLSLGLWESFLDNSLETLYLCCLLKMVNSSGRVTGMNCSDNRWSEVSWCLV